MWLWMVVGRWWWWRWVGVVDVVVDEVVDVVVDVVDVLGVDGVAR